MMTTQCLASLSTKVPFIPFLNIQHIQHHIASVSLQGSTLALIPLSLVDPSYYLDVLGWALHRFSNDPTTAPGPTMPRVAFQQSMTEPIPGHGAELGRGEQNKKQTHAPGD